MEVSTRYSLDTFQLQSFLGRHFWTLSTLHFSDLYIFSRFLAVYFSFSVSGVCWLPFVRSLRPRNAYLCKLMWMTTLSKSSGPLIGCNRHRDRDVIAILVPDWRIFYQRGGATVITSQCHKGLFYNSRRMSFDWLPRDLYAASSSPDWLPSGKIDDATVTCRLVARGKCTSERLRAWGVRGGKKGGRR